MASVRFSLQDNYWVFIESDSHPFHFYILSNLDNVDSNEMENIDCCYQIFFNTNRKGF